MKHELSDLQCLLDSGVFHHATYRDIGTVWEGLMVYVASNNSIGYEPTMLFGKNNPDLRAAEEMVRGTGISVGAYGQG